MNFKLLKPSKRKLVQLYSALFYNAYIKGFIKGDIYTGKTKVACVPGLNCYSCPAAVGACPLGSLQASLATVSDRIGFYIIGILLLYGIIAGRTVCGWLCPFGLIQELLHIIPTKKIKKSKFTRILSLLKYILLAVFVIIIPLYFGLFHNMTVPAFCKFICPAGTMEGAIGLLANPANKSMYDMLGFYFTNKLVILLILVIACVFVYRGFCRFICPLGALYGLFNKFCLVGVKTDENACNGCGLCVKACPMDIKHVSDRECIQCGKCINVCSQGALSFIAGKIVLKSNEIRPQTTSVEETDINKTNKKTPAVIARVLAVALLIFVLIWFNFLDPSSKSARNIEGYEEGQILNDFTIECVDGYDFHLEEYRGKTVVINLWATYCGPCVKEMPYFCDFADAHPDDVVVLAVHHPLTVTDVNEFLNDNDWNILFAVDTEDPVTVWDNVGGTSVMPQTIVLNKDGVVVVNHRGSITPEMLEEYYEEANVLSR